MIYYDKDDGAGGGGAPAEERDVQPKSFEEWLSSQDDEVRELYEQHTSGLKSALEKEKEARKSLSQQLKELVPKAEKGSELEQKLTETVSRLESAERRALFAEQANQVECVNPKAAYALAVSEDLFDENGQPEWKKIKEIAPELFRRTAKTDAGVNESAPVDINAAIRKATGRFNR